MAEENKKKTKYLFDNRALCLSAHGGRKKIVSLVKGKIIINNYLL